MKISSVIYLLLAVNLTLDAQLSSKDVDRWIATWPYASTENVDSLPGWIEQLSRAESALDYPRAGIYATRLKAYYHDFKGDINQATQYYILFLEGARKHELLDDEISAVLDLVYVYLNTSQLNLAKLLLQEYAPKSQHPSVSPKKRSALYNNMGVTYAQLDILDSAIIAYNEALAIKEIINDSAGIADLRINLASLHNRTQNFRESLRLSVLNLSYLDESEQSTDLVYNLINKGGAHHGLGDHSSAEKHFMRAAHMAESLGSDHLKERSYFALTTFYEHLGDFENAFKYLVLNNQHKQGMVDEQTNSRIAELREKYEAEKREQENLLLTTTLILETNRRRLYLLGLLATALLTLTITWAWYKNQSKNRALRQKNALITSQKDTLTRLNSEKNTLISIVSHDLSSPLSAIKIWAQGLRRDPVEEFEEGKSVIISTSQKALQTIKKVLQIESEEMRSLELEEIALSDILLTLQSTFSKQAQIKKVRVVFTPYRDLDFVTDREMLLRALENLVSNALKFSPPSSIVSITCEQQDGLLSFHIIDQGPGINEEEQNKIFRAYFQGSAKPTSGEPSTGLGLSIVKRIADELGGDVSVTSRPPNGATFSFSVKL